MSKLPEVFVKEPDSNRIVERLTSKKAFLCEHGRNPCYLRCGVRYVQAWQMWVIIPLEERCKWLDDVMADGKTVKP